MKNFLPLLLLLGCTFWMSQTAFAQGPTCAEAQPFCTEVGALFPAGVDNGTAEPGNNYDCLGTQPNPAWYYLKIDEPGDINILETNSNEVDVDFALWGPFPSVSNAVSECGNLQEPVDCGYSPIDVENIDIFGAETGEVYLLLITNFSNDPTDISAQQINGNGSTDCSIIDLCPDVSGVITSGPLCAGESFTATTIDVTLFEGDVLGYVLHANADDDVSNAATHLDFNASGTFTNNNTTADFGTFYVSALADKTMARGYPIWPIRA